jgi:hypothetical protein
VLELLSVIIGGILWKTPLVMFVDIGLLLRINFKCATSVSIVSLINDVPEIYFMSMAIGFANLALMITANMRVIFNDKYYLFKFNL